MGCSSSKTQQENQKKHKLQIKTKSTCDCKRREEERRRQLKQLKQDYIQLYNLYEPRIIKADDDDTINEISESLYKELSYIDSIEEEDIKDLIYQEKAEMIVNNHVFNYDKQYYNTFKKLFYYGDSDVNTEISNMLELILSNDKKNSKCLVLDRSLLVNDNVFIINSVCKYIKTSTEINHIGIYLSYNLVIDDQALLFMSSLFCCSSSLFSLFLVVEYKANDVFLYNDLIKNILSDIKKSNSIRNLSIMLYKEALSVEIGDFLLSAISNMSIEALGLYGFHFNSDYSFKFIGLLSKQQSNLRVFVYNNPYLSNNSDIQSICRVLSTVNSLKFLVLSVSPYEIYEGLYDDCLCILNKYSGVSSKKYLIIDFFSI